MSKPYRNADLNYYRYYYYEQQQQPFLFLFLTTKGYNHRTKETHLLYICMRQGG